MRKTLNIGGSEIVFESNLLTPFLYKQEFKCDYMKDLLKIMNVMEFGDLEKLDLEKLDYLDTTPIIQFAYACAKTANRDIEPFMDWIENHLEFDLLEDGMKVLELVGASMDSKKKYKTNSRVKK